MLHISLILTCCWTGSNQVICSYYNSVLSIFLDHKGKQLPLVVVQYSFLFGKKLPIKAVPHGNSTHNDRPCIRTQHSMLDEIKENVITVVNIVNKVESDQHSRPASRTRQGSSHYTRIQNSNNSAIFSIDHTWSVIINFTTHSPGWSAFRRLTITITTYN